MTKYKPGDRVRYHVLGEDHVGVIQEVTTQWEEEGRTIYRVGGLPVWEREILGYAEV